MLKLLKDLTRPPEPISPRPSPRPGTSELPHASGSGTLPYTPRSRSSSLAGGGSVPPSPRIRAAGSKLRPSLEAAEEVEVKEEDEQAKKVVELLTGLTGMEGSIMGYVEVLSQLNSIPGTLHTYRAFRRQRGFQKLIRILETGLAPKAQAQTDGTQEESEVEEVQRFEGVRIWFEVLSWALQDRTNVKAFEELGGHHSLLPILRTFSISTPTRLSFVLMDRNAGSSSSSAGLEATPGPQPAPLNPKILAHLLAHILNNNYTILSLISSQSEAADLDILTEELGDIVLSRPNALPLLWSYLWGCTSGLSNDSTISLKGKQRASQASDEDQLIEDGAYENIDSTRSRLIDMTFRILFVTAQVSTANLFALRKGLPKLPDFLMTRIYGRTPERKYEVTFPPRDDWFTDDEDEEDSESPTNPWRPPNEDLRKVYHTLLKKLLEGGVNQPLVWRLFTLVKTLAPAIRAIANGKSPPMRSQPINALSSPSTMGTTIDDASSIGTSITETMDSPMDLEDEGNGYTPTPSPTGKKRKLPFLQIRRESEPASAYKIESLHPEVLDLIRHTMRYRWPDLFHFRGSMGGVGAEGGIELRELGRSWPNSAKGFNFSCWVYITKLNRPITLLQISQAKQRHPLFQVRILENSQVALLSSVYSAESPETQEEPEEIICSAPDALIAHGQWVHFAVGCRKPKGSETSEAKIFVNGVRVGAMILSYPVPAPPTPAPQPTPAVAKPQASPNPIRICLGSDTKTASKDSSGALGREEQNEWMLGRTLLVEDTLPEDIVLLVHHLGPRYHGNLQEPLGKFLTYEAATSINIYLSAQAQGATDKRLFTSASTSVLVKAIRSGPAIPEENILLSLSAKDVYSSSLPINGSTIMDIDSCINGAVAHPLRAKQLKNGIAHFTGAYGSIEGYPSCALDNSVSCVGGGAVVLKMIELSQNSEQLAITLGLLRDLIKNSWSASEEMERIRGFELLAAILRPKMSDMMDITCTKTILNILGINMDKPAAATVHNSAAYRALGLEFELWANASLGVVTLYLQHFEYLMSTSKHARYNILRTFQKAAIVRKMLYALRSGCFDLNVVPVVVDTLKLVLISRWSGEDALKPVFSYLVSTLCQSTSSIYPSSTSLEPPPSQAPAAQILAMIAALSHNPQRLIKLSKSLALHRLLVILISSNSAPYVVVPCLDILEECMTTPGLESFSRSFESEGGFALLARTLGPIWSGDIQRRIIRMMLGPGDNEGKTLACPTLISALTAALDCLLQGGPGDEPTFKPTRRSSLSSVRSVGMTPISASGGASGLSSPDDTRLQSLLEQMRALFKVNSIFRRSFTGRRVEQILPAFVDFAAVSSSSSNPDNTSAQRSAAAQFLQAIIDKHKISHSLINQLKLIVEQLNAPVSRLASSSSTRPPSSPRPSSINFGHSFSGRYGGTPPGTPLSSGPIPRRRPSTDAGSMISPSPFASMTKLRSGVAERKAPALKRVLTGESILEGGRDKNAAWKLIIIQTDSQSHSKMVLERKEYWNKLSEVDWRQLAAGLQTENGLWAEEDGPVGWRLDGSEGPLRMRNRLERVKVQPEPAKEKLQRKLRDAIPSLDSLSSAVSRINVAPWEDPFALALGEAAPIAEEGEAPLVDPSAPAPRPPSPTPDSRIEDDFVEIEENSDDKMRRIAKSLQAGDVVEEAHNIVRIVGVDACPGLLILGKKNLYLVDGLVQTAEGEVINATDAPRDVLTIPGTIVDFSNNEQESYRWPYNEIVENNKRAFLFRDVALEMYFADKRNFLIVFKDKRERQTVVSKLQYKSDQTGVISRSLIGNFVLDQVVRAIEKPEQQLDALTRKWQNREISNFAYLSLLNQHANRTPNDVTQYPVFPWVLSDYASQILDLDKASSFRDLSLPMGALTPARKEAAIERYSATEGVGEKPFHYGTHYSSSMIVCGFMIRLSPFTEIFLALQGGNFDLADRLFSSIPRAWDSASADNRGDVRELIPEFFYSSAFLLNVNRHDFGKKQVSGDSVDDVVLPPWALGDPLLFIHRQREALESDYVSRHLPAWIDLTFGYKQRDPAAYNCFHPLSYRGAVDLENMEDESEKAASTAIIHNFGQTPLQIFKHPHIHKFMMGKTSLPMNQRFGVAEQWELLIRSIIPILETPQPIYNLADATTIDGKPIPYQRYRLTIPTTQLSVQYGFVDDSLRIYYQDIGSVSARLVYLTEGVSVKHAVLASPTLLVTVSAQGTITVWRLTVKSYGSRKGDVDLQREATLRGHAGQVTCLTASTSWSFLVTGAEDGVAMMWDMNRFRYIRTLQLPCKESIRFCSVHESDGQIALATKEHLYLYSLNGHPIASTRVDSNHWLPKLQIGLPDAPEIPVFDDEEDEPPEFTGGISFLKRDFLKFGVLFVVGIGREIAVFRCLPGKKRFEDEEDVPPWTLEEQGRLTRSDDHIGGNCCMVKFVGETLYAAFEPAEGSTKYSLYQWSLPEGGARHVPDSVAHSCMQPGCGRHFGLLEPKRFCGGCGGCFCGTHAVHVETLEQRYCETCRGQLSQNPTLLSFRRDTSQPRSRRGSMITDSRSSSRRPSFTGSPLAHTSTNSISRHSKSSSTSRSASRRPSPSLPPRSRATTNASLSSLGPPALGAELKHGASGENSTASISSLGGPSGSATGTGPGGAREGSPVTARKSRDPTPIML